MLLFCQLGYGQTNGGFETINGLTKKPTGWLLSMSNLQEQAYKVNLDSIEKKQGKYSLSIQKVNNISEFTMFDFAINKEYEGKSIELRGSIKTEDVKKGFAGLWLSLDGIKRLET